jgi:gluconolactonase
VNLARASMPPVVFLVLVAVSPAAQAQESAGAIFPPGARLEKLFDRGQFTEGPAVAPDGRVFFSDLPFVDDSKGEAGHIWCYDPRRGTTKIYRSPSGMSNGLEFDSLGRLISVEMETGRIVQTDLRTGRSRVIAGTYNGRRFNALNDLVLDGKGNIYFTDPWYGNRQDLPQPVTGVYRLDRAGNSSLLIGDIPNPNGIALSPDQTRLYVGCYDEGEPKVMRIVEYSVTSTGAAEFRKIFADYTPRDGPDGFAVDSRGDLYVALRDESRPGIAVYSPAGDEIGFLPLPEVPSNIAFDRPPHCSRLYITAGKSLYRMTVGREGHFPFTNSQR